MSRTLLAVFLVAAGCVQNLTGTPVVPGTPAEDTAPTDTDTGGADTAPAAESVDQDGEPDTAVPVDTAPEDSPADNGRDTGDTGPG
jgi:hypothetical protein